MPTRTYIKYRSPKSTRFDSKNFLNGRFLLPRFKTMPQNTVHRINPKNRPRCTQTVTEIPLEFQGFTVSCFWNISKLQTRLAVLGITGEILGEKKIIQHYTHPARCLRMKSRKKTSLNKLPRLFEIARPLGTGTDKFCRHKTTRWGAKNNSQSLKPRSFESLMKQYQSIPTFLTQKFGCKLHRFQYPLKNAKRRKYFILCVTLVTSQRHCVHRPRNTESVYAKKKSQCRSPSSRDASNWHAWSCVFFALFCIVRVCVEPSSLDAMFLVAKHNSTTPELSQ